MGPADLMKVLEGLPLREDRLLVGPESLDDAGVYALDQNTALIQTVDFFTPLVDDPYDFGAVAAANALSDVYAMGGVPLTALAVVCFPAKGVDLAIMRHMLLGKEIKFGFAVTGIVKPSQIVRVSGARAGDSLVLTKPLGTGVLAHALKAGVLSEKARDAFVASMKELNAAAREAMLDTGANACTDVTGFGLLGHALNIARSSKVTLLFRPDRIQFFPEAPDLVTKKMCPGGLNRNREYVTPYLETRARGPALELLFDPQTSGGLLISVPADRCQDLLAALKEKGVVCAAAIGEVREREGPYLIVE
jgi:selenide,water dikinase